ncbi:MAG: heavy-metal-associated domain-containing protein [Candidatus Heimdallarchaeaceae archaeon]
MKNNHSIFYFLFSFGLIANLKTPFNTVILNIMILTVEYNIPDMHCKKCANKISLALQFTAGVSSAILTLDDHHATVNINPMIISGSRIKAMIIALGYNAMII